MADFERLIGLADTYGTRARVDYSAPDGDDDTGIIGIAIECGTCSGRAPDVATRPPMPPARWRRLCSTPRTASIRTQLMPDRPSSRPMRAPGPEPSIQIQGENHHA